MRPECLKIPYKFRKSKMQGPKENGQMNKTTVDKIDLMLKCCWIFKTFDL